MTIARILTCCGGMQVEGEFCAVGPVSVAARQHERQPVQINQPRVFWKNQIVEPVLAPFLPSAWRSSPHRHTVLFHSLGRLSCPTAWPWRHGRGYRVPGEFVIVSAAVPDGQRVIR